MRWLDSSTDMNLSQLWEIVKDRGAWHAVIYGITKSQTRLNNNNKCNTQRSVVLNETQGFIYSLDIESRVDLIKSMFA